MPHAVCIPRKSVAPISFLFSHHYETGDDGGETRFGDGHRVRDSFLYCFAFAQVRAGPMEKEYASCTFGYVVYFWSLLWHYQDGFRYVQLLASINVMAVQSCKYLTCSFEYCWQLVT